MSGSSRSGLLAVKGAKYNRRNDDGKEKPLDRIQQIPKGAELEYTPNFTSQQNPATLSSSGNIGTKTSQSNGSGSTAMLTKSNSLSALLKADSANTEKYWKLPGGGGTEDLVIIHVCDENQQISKDFCCKRDILVHHMKYFEKFLAENENGYDDIDISVHCDVEIFEWLMSYIHEPDTPPQIDKSIIVSILISSEFLQMETLVEHCIQHVSSCLNEIIRLPIDLSCISEKLINRVAFITQPKTLSETRDKKDKILTKLYKRRVELDFSRKGSSVGKSGGTAFRTIAASLACCRHCGSVYLDNYVGYLTCRSSPPTINFRGQLASRHSAIAGWSLTSYLKTLHSGGMGWDAIYWHVWAACVVFRVENVMVSALEVDRYTVELDGLLVRASILKDSDSSADDEPSSFSLDPSVSIVTPGSNGRPPLMPKTIAPVFSLSVEDDCRLSTASPQEILTHKLTVSKMEDSVASMFFVNSPGITSTLNPHRPPEVLTSEIYALICSQMKYIVSLAHKQLIQNTMRSIVESARATEGAQTPYDFSELLWGPGDGGADGGGDTGTERRRGRSPGRIRASSLEPRKLASSSVKAKSTSSALNTAAATGDNTSCDSSDNEVTTAKSDRLRSRSSSMGNRSGAHQSSSGKLLTKVLKKESKSDDMGGNSAGDPVTTKQIGILLSLPPEVRQKVLSTRGPVYGVWNSTHPIQLISPAYEDMLQTIADTPQLSDAKRMEWELDVMREQDEKRMDRYERLLVSKRNAAVDNYFQFQKNKSVAQNSSSIRNQLGGTKTTTGTATAISGGYFATKASSSNSDYYKDRGRQTYRL